MFNQVMNSFLPGFRDHESGWGLPSYTLKWLPQKRYFKTKLAEVCIRVSLNKKKLKQLKPESLNLPAGVKFTSMKVYVNTTKKFGQTAGNWDAKWILSFWVSNGSMRVKLVNEKVSIITHDCDLEKLFRGDTFIADND